MNRVLAWSAGAGLVALAWGVAAVTPAPDAEEAPFIVDVAVDEEGVGRNIAVTVTDITRAGEVSAGEWSAEGNWVVVDLDAEAIVSETGALLALATLEVDGRTFTASERPDSLLRKSLAVGIPQSGSVAFELADDVTGGQATLSFGETGDSRLDSLIVVHVDLDDVAVRTAAELEPTGWSSR